MSENRPVIRTLVLLIATTYLAGCSKSDPSYDVPPNEGKSLNFLNLQPTGGGIPILPNSPRATLQPLSPGNSWTYQVAVDGNPKSIRWFTKDGSRGAGFSVVGLFSPFDEVKRGRYAVKFTIAEEKTNFFADGNKSAFFGVTAVEPESGKNLLGDEKLWWGRWRYSPMDIAICEVRSIGSASAQMIKEGVDLSLYPKDFADKRLHFRYLAADNLFDFPEYGQVTVGIMSISDSDRWSVESHGDIESVTVPAGAFPQCFRTDFKFSMSGNTENYISETLFYSAGTGLVKWKQMEDGVTLWNAELTSFDVGQK